MKRCPECRRDYYDETLLYCLEDGVQLVQGSVPVSQSVADEPTTAIIHTSESVGEAPTRAQIHTTEQTAVLPSGIAALPKSGFDKRLLALPFLLAIIGLGGFFGYKYFSPAKQIESIAVMPFVNKSGNADVEYLSDGMTETLISGLSQLPNLDVKPRSSVFRYKGKETDPQAIGRELNVQAVLNGRVTQRGQDISLYVELIDIVRNKTIWSETYNRKTSEILSLQSEIARDVSSKLKTKLSTTDEAKVTKNYTADPEAYQLYLKGNYYRTKYNEEGYKKGIEFYKQAIAIDPNYALPYVGIAAAYTSASDWYLAPNDAMPKQKAFLQKAVELDDTVGEAHYYLGATAFWYDWDWPTAEREFKSAEQLDSAYGAFGLYYSAMGRQAEAIKAQEAFVRNFPLDLDQNNGLEGVYLFAGRFDDAINQARKTLEIDPNFWGSYENLGRAFERKKQFPEAIAALEKARAVDNNPEILGYLGYVYAAAGKKVEAQKVLDELKELSKHRHVPPYSFAVIYAGLNDKDLAFEWLERAFEAHSYAMTLLKVETVFDNIRPDPRFKDLLKRMNLPE